MYVIVSRIFRKASTPRMKTSCGTRDFRPWWSQKFAASNARSSGSRSSQGVFTLVFDRLSFGSSFTGKILTVLRLEELPYCNLYETKLQRWTRKQLLMIWNRKNGSGKAETGVTRGQTATRLAAAWWSSSNIVNESTRHRSELHRAETDRNVDRWPGLRHTKALSYVISSGVLDKDNAHTFLLSFAWKAKASSPIQ